MSTTEIILIAIGGFLALVVLVGMLLRRKVLVTRAIKIKAAPEDVYPHVVDLKNFVEWSPWTERDPNAKFTFSEPSHGVGASYEWAGDKKKIGTGSMEITSCEEFKKVTVNINFGRNRASEGYWTIEESEGMTRVTWGFVADMGMNPISRYFGLLMDRFIGPDFEHGLHKLKAKLENPS